MVKNLKVGILALFICLSACADTNAPVVPDVVTPETQETTLVPFEILDNGTISGAQQDKTTLEKFDDKESWQAFWSKHMTVVPQPPAPDVDFETKSLIAIVDSDQPNSGYYLELSRIEQSNNELWVYVIRKQPSTQCMNLGMVAQPFVFATIAKSPLNAKLMFSTQFYDC